jgi:hypothetical protein
MLLLHREHLELSVSNRMMRGRGSQTRAQKVCLSLDTFKKSWAFTSDNRLYRPPMILVALLSSALTSVCSFPATVTVILLMGVNVFVVTFVIIAMN